MAKWLKRTICSIWACNASSPFFIPLPTTRTPLNPEKKMKFEFPSSKSPSPSTTTYYLNAARIARPR